MRITVARLSAAALALILVAWPAGAHTGADGRSQCSGVAPGATYCSNGLHDAFNWYEGIPNMPVSQQGLLIFDGYTGSIETRLEWPAVNPTQQRSFRCDVVDGVASPSSCVSNGNFPPPMVHFLHTCRSWKIGSASQQGGAGRWGCYVDHDASPLPLPAIVDQAR